LNVGFNQLFNATCDGHAGSAIQVATSSHIMSGNNSFIACCITVEFVIALAIAIQVSHHQVIHSATIVQFIAHPHPHPAGAHIACPVVGPPLQVNTSQLLRLSGSQTRTS
jgi:hypothetical protein